MAKATNKVTAKVKKKVNDFRQDYLYAMSHAPSIDQSSSIANMIPIACFAALVILAVRMYSYYRPMTQFFWTDSFDAEQITDFFSYYKMVMIILAAVIALLMMLFWVTSQSFAVKRCYAYIPMLVYSVFVILSYIFSQYKEFALWGWNDRFEGTIPIICYMIMLFLIINSVNTERNIKQIVIPIAVSAFILSLLGLSQALDMDFFRTNLGQKILVPNLLLENGTTTWQNIDAATQAGDLYLKFTFNNKEIYQTVYNINYVSFYLTLLVPLFGMLFIRAMRDPETRITKKASIGILLALLVYNLIGSQSSGGYLGIGVAVIVAIVLLNKQLIKWLKPLLIVILVVVIVMATTVGRWWPELSGAVKSVLGISSQEEAVVSEDTKLTHEAGSVAPTIDYIITKGNTVTMSLEGNELVAAVELSEDEIVGMTVSDAEGNVLNLIQNDTGIYEIEDERFHDYATVAIAYDGTRYFVQITTGSTSEKGQFSWNFIPMNGEMYYYSGVAASAAYNGASAEELAQKVVKLDKVKTIGFKNNMTFGSGRGEIWAHSFPLIKNTLLIGTGADTYCAVYPQNDYAAKWNNNGKCEENLLLIVDKPHNMYIHMAIGTGCISLIAILVLYGTYLVQSFKLFWKRDLENDFLLFAGVGTFLGCTGFMVSGLVDDSTVSVMPLFYTMLGMGISINMIIKRRDAKKLAVE